MIFFPNSDEKKISHKRKEIMWTMYALKNRTRYFLWYFLVQLVLLLLQIWFQFIYVFGLSSMWTLWTQKCKLSIYPIWLFRSISTDFWYTTYTFRIRYSFKHKIYPFADDYWLFKITAINFYSIWYLYVYYIDVITCFHHFSIYYFSF